MSFLTLVMSCVSVAGASGAAVFAYLATRNARQARENYLAAEREFVGILQSAWALMSQVRHDELVAPAMRVWCDRARAFVKAIENHHHG